jgi:hypothetical protein
MFKIKKVGKMSVVALSILGMLLAGQAASSGAGIDWFNR